MTGKKGTDSFFASVTPEKHARLQGEKGCLSPFFRNLLAGVATSAICLWWAFAQPAPQPLDAIMPAGALVYLEARDFATLLRDWDASTEKRNWLPSSNYEVFSRSRLFLKLADAQTEFAAAAGLPPDYALLQNIAGSNSAVALYDIGKLDFLYVTRLPSARALNTALWRSRASYQTRRAGTVDYYVKQDQASQRTAAFAYTGDLLLLATREDALSGALELIARVNRPSIASEPWFAAAVQSAEPGAGDLRLVYNMERLATSFQFRSHWIQRNVADLREFTSGLADLDRASGEFRERRVLLRATPTADLTPSESPAGQLLAMAPDTAGFYRVSVTPSAEQISRWIATKLFNAIPGAAPRRDNAPGLAAEFNSGSEADLETRIDEPPLLDDRSAQAFIAVNRQIAGTPVQAMLEVSSTLVQQQVFVRPQSAVILLAGQPWDINAVQQALTQAADGIWTHTALGAGWRTAASGIRELDGLGHLSLAVDGNRLILGDSTDLVNAILARRAQPALPGAVYAAGWRHARELPNFERMMRLIDFPEIRAVPDGSSREPLFYSENLASLGRVLSRVDSATITVHDLGPVLRESLVYRVAP